MAAGIEIKAAENLRHGISLSSGFDAGKEWHGGMKNVRALGDVCGMVRGTAIAWANMLSKITAVAKVYKALFYIERDVAYVKSTELDWLAAAVLLPSAICRGACMRSSHICVAAKGEGVFCCARRSRHAQHGSAIVKDIERSTQTR